MAIVASGTFGNYTHYLDVTLVSQSIINNTSTLSYNYYIHRNTSSTNGAYTTTANHAFYATIDGQTFGGGRVFNFKTAADISMVSGTVVVGHAANGTKGLYASFSGPNPTFTSGFPYGSATSGLITLTTIPRASNPTFSPNPAEFGSNVTITTNRASGTFTHTIEYALGASTGSIATGVGASTVWAIPNSLMSEIPNSTLANIAITTKTYDGATLIGTTVTNLPVDVPSTVVPDFTTVTHSETVTVVATEVGAYVQGLTKLALAITGAAGVYGSTISSYKIEVAGQTINAASGTLPVPLSVAGTYNIVGTITDSRSRVKTKNVSITVLAYTPPAIDPAVFRLRRSDAAGTPDEEGTYIRIDLKADAQSLLVSSVQKNNLTYKIYTRLRDDLTWDLQDTVNTGSVAFNSYDTVGTYAIESAWEVRIEVLDKFATAAIAGTIATAAIFMHWDENGLAVGKFWEQGALDVKGQIYQNDGKAVLDEDDLTTLNSAISDATTTLATLSRRNRIINGRCSINQRGVVTGGIGLNNSFTFDRWKFVTDNLAFNPNALTTATPWGGSNSTITRITGQTIPGLTGVTTAIRGTQNAATTGGLYFPGDVTAPYVKVTPGASYRVSLYLKASVAKTVTPSVQWKTTFGNGSSLGSPVALAANTWTRVDVTVTAPGDAVAMGPYFYSTTAWAAGNTLDAAGLLIQEGSALNAYRDPATVTFTAAPQGQAVTISSGTTVRQTIERADIESGTYTLSWTGTVQGRVYNSGTTAPAFSSSPVSVALNGLADVIVELSAVSGASTFDYVQLEKGSASTAYEQRPYAEELALCMRYFRLYAVGAMELINPYFNVALAAGGMQRIPLGTPMRVAPYVTTDTNFVIVGFSVEFNTAAGAAGYYFTIASIDPTQLRPDYAAAYNSGVTLASSRYRGLNSSPVWLHAEL